MNTQQAYINGFIKRASEYGLNQYQAVELLKQATITDDPIKDNSYLNRPTYRRRPAPNQNLGGGQNPPKPLGGDSLENKLHKNVGVAALELPSAVDKFRKNINDRFGNVIEPVANAARKFEDFGHNFDAPVKGTTDLINTAVVNPVVDAFRAPTGSVTIPSVPGAETVGKTIVDTALAPTARFALRSANPLFSSGFFLDRAATKANEGDLLGAWMDRATGGADLTRGLMQMFPGKPPASPTRLSRFTRKGLPGVLGLTGTALAGSSLARDIYKQVEPTPENLERIEQTLETMKRIQKMRQQYFPPAQTTPAQTTPAQTTPAQTTPAETTYEGGL